MLGNIFHPLLWETSTNQTPPYSQHCFADTVLTFFHHCCKKLRSHLVILLQVSDFRVSSVQTILWRCSCGHKSTVHSSQGKQASNYVNIKQTKKYNNFRIMTIVLVVKFLIYTVYYYQQLKFMVINHILFTYQHGVSKFLPATVLINKSNVQLQTHMSQGHIHVACSYNEYTWVNRYVTTMTRLFCLW